ncbi:hypothetical protein OSTOST_13179, partial [Ostertagia ostertagi]
VELNISLASSRLKRRFQQLPELRNGDFLCLQPYIPSFLRNIVSVVKSFSGGGNVRVLSPRLAPLLPDKGASHGILSPALFPFYKDESEEQILPVPKMLEDSGLNEKDRERILEMVMEISGARGTVENAMKVITYSQNVFREYFF